MTDTTTRADVGDVLGVDTLRDRCSLLEASLRLSGPDVLNAVSEQRPGTAANPDQSAHGWLHYLCALHRAHERSGAAVAVAGMSSRWDPAIVETTRAALAAVPIPLTLSTGHKVAVHPKGEFALHRMVVVDAVLSYAAAHRLAMCNLPLEERTPLALDVLKAATELQRQCEREYVTIACHDGADIPAEPGAPYTWEIPLAPWSEHIDGADVLLIRQAAHTVNFARIAEIVERTKQYAENKTGSLPIAAFLGIMASDLHVRAKDLARQYSVGEVVAQALLRWEQNEQQRKQAKDPKDSLTP